jgi:predicted MPP superfamily phosphohydrolase
MMINIDNVSINYEPKFEILKDSKQYIKKIIHIAYIHIRLSTLHDEYNEVFRELYNDLENLKKHEPNTLICLCGDLLHSKDELKPNTIIQTWNFIKNLSDIFPLIIITGNHDTIELNSCKIDSITAILRDRPIENTYYLINSGVYIYNNIIFGVSSIIDKYMMSINKTEDILTLNNHIFTYSSYTKYIALYHGSVDGCIMNDYGTRSRGLKKVSDFACPLTHKNYDYILLGDIHKFQFLH